jgi:hypothetical protein
MNRHDPEKNGEIRSLYPRSSASATATWTERRSVGMTDSAGVMVPTETAFEGLAEFALKGSQAGIDQRPSWDDDDIHARCQLIATKNLSNEPFCFISHDSAAHFPSRGDSKPAPGKGIGERKQRKKPAVYLAALVVDLLVFDPVADAFVTQKCCGCFWHLGGHRGQILQKSTIRC